MIMLHARYVGIDIHKRHVTIAATNARQEELLAPRKVYLTEFPAWIEKHLDATDQVAIEATTNSWAFYDLLSPYVAEVAVANSNKLKIISSSARKTDRHDARNLAKLYAAGLLPQVWVPPQLVRELRSITLHRSKLSSQFRAAKNRLHAVLHRHNLELPDGGPFTQTNRKLWGQLPLADIEKLQVQHDWQMLELLQRQINETEAVIAQLSVTEHWRESMTYLIQMTGIGLYTGMIILAAIGNVQRFSSPEKLVGYSGLGARIHASGDKHYTGKISKRGRKELRWALITSAWVAVRFSDHWREQFQRLSQRLGKQKAITAIARKLLVTIWHVLSKKEADRFADPQAVARSMMTWSSQHHLARSIGIRRIKFVKQGLELIGMADQVQLFKANGRTHYFKDCT